MTLYDLLSTCNHTTRVRIHFGEDKQYFDIRSEQREAFIKWLEYTDNSEDETPVLSWNVQNITFTEWGKEGDRIDTIERVLFIQM